MSNVSQRTAKAAASVEKDQQNPEAVIGQLFKNMYQSMRLAMDESLRREGALLSFAHFGTLYALAAEPGVAGAKLARRGSVTAQTMNMILRRLEQDGLIERRPNPANQRADSWSLTKAGQLRLQKAKVVAERVWSGIFESFNADEVAQLQHLLQRCLSGLEKQIIDLRSAKTSRPAKKPVVKKKRK